MGRITRTNFGLTKTVTIDNDQIKNWDASPVTLIDAPGVDRVIVPVACCAVTVLPVAYTGLDADAFIEFLLSSAFLSFIPNDSGGGLNVLTAFLTGDIHGNVWSVPPIYSAVTGWDSGVYHLTSRVDLNRNMPLIVHLDNNGAGPLAGGDPANKIQFTVFYNVIDVSGLGIS